MQAITLKFSHQETYEGIESGPPSPKKIKGYYISSNTEFGISDACILIS